MPTPDIIHNLIRRFEEQYDSYRSDSYNETQLRREFLDPFFVALGWDVHNRKGWAEAYKDVIHEDAIRVGGATKAPDYAFRIGGTRKFFVEAKKPAVYVREDVHPTYQLRRYAWSAKLPLSILTDFEELAVYDCRQKPDKSDKASTGRVEIYHFRDYAEKWGTISAVLSREAVLKGSFDRHAESMKGKRGTAKKEIGSLFPKKRDHTIVFSGKAFADIRPIVRQPGQFIFWVPRKYLQVAMRVKRNDIIGIIFKSVNIHPRRCGRHAGYRQTDNIRPFQQ